MSEENREIHRIDSSCFFYCSIALNANWHFSNEVIMQFIASSRILPRTAQLILFAIVLSWNRMLRYHPRLLSRLHQPIISVQKLARTQAPSINKG
jgi:hypothetical protein